MELAIVENPPLSSTHGRSIPGLQRQLCSGDRRFPIVLPDYDKHTGHSGTSKNAARLVVGQMKPRFIRSSSVKENMSRVTSKENVTKHRPSTCRQN